MSRLLSRCRISLGVFFIFSSLFSCVLSCVLSYHALSCLLPFLYLIYVLSLHSCVSIQGAAREARAAAHPHARPRSIVESPRPPLRRSSTSSHTSRPRPTPVTVSRYVSSTFSLSYLFGYVLKELG